MDDFVEETGVKQIDFLKIEAEGAEPEILFGANNTLRNVSRIAIDCGPERYGEPTVEVCDKMLNEAGFSVERKGSPHFVLLGHRT